MMLKSGVSIRPVPARIGGQGAPVSGCVAWYRYPPALSETQPSGPQFDIRTENGFPVPGIRGWNSGAAASTS